MSTQQLFAQAPQAPFGFAEEEQSAIAFPLTLAEKYQPRHLDDLVGLAAPRRILNALVLQPRPCAMLFVGNPGVGKTIAGLCFADTLGGSLVHVSAQKCDVATLDSLRDRFAYFPPKGKFWVCLIDEADQMTEKAQVQLLSRLDATASLTPGFGGAVTRQTSPPIIWIFTANGTGKQGTIPPTSLERRFLSRCMVIPFETMPEAALSQYLRTIWAQETDLEAAAEYFDYMAIGGGVRESLNTMQVDILSGAPRPIPQKEVDAAHYAKIDRNIQAIADFDAVHAPKQPRIAGWRRVYGGSNDRVDRIKRHLAAHKIESHVRDVATGNRPGARKSISVRPENYSQAMTLVAGMKA